MRYEQIINQGELGHSMYIIAVGHVKVVKQKTIFDDHNTIAKKIRALSKGDLTP